MRDLTKLEGEVVRAMYFGAKMISTEYHIFVGKRRTGRTVLSRLKSAGAVELDKQLRMGTQHWKLSEEGKAWAKQQNS